MSRIDDDLPDDVNDLVRDLHHPDAGVTFGTAAPFSLGAIWVGKRGFADIKAVSIGAYCRAGEFGSLISILRQFVYRELQIHGVPCEAVAVTPSIQQAGTAMFVDTNESSDTCGKRRKGVQFTAHFEIQPQFADRFEFSGSRGQFKGAKDAK